VGAIETTRVHSSDIEALDIEQADDHRDGLATSCPLFVRAFATASDPVFAMSTVGCSTLHEAFRVGRPAVLPRGPARPVMVAGGAVHTVDEDTRLVVESREPALRMVTGSPPTQPCGRYFDAPCLRHATEEADRRLPTSRASDPVRGMNAG
jgi:hypothetical protein